MDLLLSVHGEIIFKIVILEDPRDFPIKYCYKTNKPSPDNLICSSLDLHIIDVLIFLKWKIRALGIH